MCLLVVYFTLSLVLVMFVILDDEEKCVPDFLKRLWRSTAEEAALEQYRS